VNRSVHDVADFVTIIMRKILTGFGRAAFVLRGYGHGADRLRTTDPRRRWDVRAMTTAIDDGLFTWPSEAPRLVGGECRACGAVAFPRPATCSRCTSDDVAERHLGRRGTLWSFTVQRFEPKPPYDGPRPFRPYGVGYVELPGEVIVESRLTTANPDELEIGQAMELVVVPFRSGPDGHDTVTFAFRPVSETAPTAGEDTQ
jgi:uncharacterized OB-fold protein